jgi:glycosyltransferase involved in cell wall biosynthesis
MMEKSIEDIKPDIVIHLRDNWVLTDRYFGGSPERQPYNLKPICDKVDAKFVAYSPVQHKPLPKPLIDQVNAKTDFLLTMSEYGVWAYIERGFPPNKINYIYHGVSPEMKPMDKKECRQYFGFDPDAPLLGYVGLNIDYRKNLGTAVLVLKEVLKEFPTANLVLWTEPNSSGVILEDWIDSHGVRGHIYFPSKPTKVSGITDAEMAKLFNSLDCYVHTSIAEGFGMPVLEAIACGTPVVSTDDPVIHEIQKEIPYYAETSHYFPTLVGAMEHLPNPFDMGKKVIQILKNPDKERCDKGVEQAKQYTWEAAGMKLNGILNALKPMPKVN